MQQAVLPEIHWTHYMFGSELIFSHNDVQKYFPIAKFLMTPRLSSATPPYGVIVHSLRNWVLRQMQAPGWDLVLFNLYLWLLSVSTVQEIHPYIQTFNPLLSSTPLDEWTTHASILLQTCLSQLLFCFIMWLIQFSLH